MSILDGAYWEKEMHKKTHADLIRTITDEELAAMLSALGGCPLLHGIQDCPKGHSPTANCYPRACWLEWLREEAEV